MGIFGNRPVNPFAPPPVYTTPGYGDGTPQGGGIDYSVPVDPYEGHRPDAPGFFGKGRKLRDAFGYGLGALAQQFGGSNPYDEQMKNDADLQHEMALLRMKAEMEADTPQAINLGDGGVATWSRRGGLQTVREPTPTDRRTEAQRNWEYRMGLPADQRGEFDRTRPGFQFTPEGIAALGQVADLRAGATARHRAPPRSGGGGGGGVTPTARARYMAEAEAAISRGADPKAVYARLAKMGIR